MKTEWTRVDQMDQSRQKSPATYALFGARLGPFWGPFGALLAPFWRATEGDLGPLAFLGGKNVPVKDASAL